MSIEDDDLEKLLTEIDSLIEKRVGRDDDGDFTARCIHNAHLRIRTKYATSSQDLNREKKLAQWLQDLVEEVFVDELLLLLPPEQSRSTERPLLISRETTKPQQEYG
jgi:hypothetical protein